MRPPVYEPSNQRVNLLTRYPVLDGGIKNLFYAGQKQGRTMMDKAVHDRYDAGLRKIIKNGKEAFRISENLEYYSEEDFKAAEKKFLKLCIIGGRC